MFKHNVQVSVPFPNEHLATVAMQALQVEAEVKPKLIEVEFKVEQNNVNMIFSSDSLKMIRLSVNNRLEMLALIAKTQFYLSPV